VKLSKAHARWRLDLAFCFLGLTVALPLRFIAVLAGLLALLPAGPAWAQPAPVKTVRVAFSGSESGFDPARISDVVSAAVVASLFDSPLTYDLLARPVRLKPNTAALPEVSDNYTRFVFRLKAGIYFSDDPAFNGKPRELTAADYVYSIKRYYDPITRSPSFFHFENAGLIGLTALRKKALDTRQPFDYDTVVPGIRVLDRYRFEVRTDKPAPRLPFLFANASISGALAREVVESHPPDQMVPPVGTGPFRLASWTRGSRIVLERNAAYRHGVHDENPPEGDTLGRDIANQFRGRALPMVDRVVIAIIEEAQPRWLAFLNDELDMIAVPPEFISQAAPNDQVAPNLAKRGIQMRQTVIPITRHVYFGMENATVGGYEPHKVALRRALALGYDTAREISVVRHGQMVPAQSVMPPGVSGYDPALKSEMAEVDPARAKALLDLYGYVDRDGDGWRESPDGTPLVLELTTEPSQQARALQGLWQKSMKAIGVKMEFRIGAWPENIKASRAGRLMMWTTGWSAAIPDGTYFMDLLYGPNKGQANASRFDLPAFNALHERQRVLPDGPERDALIQQGMKLSLAYMPYKASGHDVQTWLMQPRVLGYLPNPFIRDFWRHIDIAPGATTP
jgi:ABC-type transport system substrate-binding protein